MLNMYTKNVSPILHFGLKVSTRVECGNFFYQTEQVN